MLLSIHPHFKGQGKERDCMLIGFRVAQDGVRIHFS